MFNVLLCGLLLAQQSTVRVSTRLVTVSVAVQAEKGGGLTKDDFVLLDEGKPQPIAVFTVNRTSTPGVTPKLPAGVFSNRYQSRATAASILLLDLTNTPRDRQEVAKQEVLRALDQLDGKTSIALYVLDGRLWVLHDFTQDTLHLKEVLRKYRTSAVAGIDLNGGSGGLSANAATAGTNLNALGAISNANMALAYSSKRVDLTLAALEAIAQHVKPYQGRKSLVWVAGVFPAALNAVGRMRLGLEGEFRDLGRLLNEADLAIYGVQDTGLATMERTTAQVEMTGRGARTPRGGSQIVAVEDGGIRTLADVSGGKAYTGMNDIADAVQQAIADTESSYTLGFYPTTKMDGKYHELRVSVKQKGIKLRHRRGYFATDDIAPEAEQLKARIQSTLTSPFDSAAIGMSVRVDASDQQRGGLRFVIGIDASMLRMQEQNGRKAALAEVMVVQHAADGRRIDSASDHVRLDLTPPQYDQLIKDGLIVVKHIQPAEGAFDARVLVMDHVTGNVGSVVIPGFRNFVKNP